MNGGELNVQDSTMPSNTCDCENINNVQEMAPTNAPTDNPGGDSGSGSSDPSSAASSASSAASGAGGSGSRK